jgi:hypothetical protein
MDRDCIYNTGNLENVDWWRLNKRGTADPCQIEWSSKGFVRARIDSRGHWFYKRCDKARFALAIGEGMVESVRRQIEEIIV